MAQNILSEHYCEGEDVTGSKININSEPKYKNYDTVEARSKSFKGIKSKLFRKRNTFAEAGFFYTGVHDNVQCFYCGGTLENCDSRDNPFEEHAGWYGKCLFIRAVKGQEFVDAFRKPVVAYCSGIWNFTW